MKPTLIAPRVETALSKYEARMNELHAYLRPDGMNAIVAAAPKPTRKPVKIDAQKVYFKPFECILNPAKAEDTGKKIDFRFG